MSDEQKYYTPAPEDIRIGFICQIDDEDDGWSDITFDSKMAQWLYPFVDRLRVPYLTAEQIEAEGFPLMDVNTGFGRFKKGDIELWYSSLHTLTVMFDNDPIFRGYCRCVNDFRLICKMLSIETTKNNAI